MWLKDKALPPFIAQPQYEPERESSTWVSPGVNGLARAPSALLRAQRALPLSTLIFGRLALSTISLLPSLLFSVFRVPFHCIHVILFYAPSEYLPSFRLDLFLAVLLYIYRERKKSFLWDKG